MTTVNLDISELSKLSNILDDYIKKAESNQNKLVKEICDTIKEKAKSGYNASWVDGYPAYAPVVSDTVANKGWVEAYGDAVWVEFGAGIHYNGGKVGAMPNPYAKQLGWSIGNYGHKLGRFHTWHYRAPETGEWVPTHGTRATKPLYNAVSDVKKNIKSMANDIWKEGAGK